jgi:acetyltransferase
VHILDPFFKPRTVVIIGLSRSAIGAPVSVLTSLESLGYQGRIYLVNPGIERTDKIHAYPRIEDLPESIDLAIVSVERGRVPGVLLDCTKIGIRSAVVITQGFADADEEGRRLQDEIRVIVKQTGLRILGPNTIGLVNAFEHFTSSFIEVREDHAPIGQVAQSGLFMMGYHHINNEPAGYCMSIDLGNSSDIGLTDVLDYFDKEPKIRVIQCHLEGVTDGRAFVDAAARITQSKPIIALKAGTTSAGRAAVASHTGAVAGANEVFRAAFRKAGITQAGTAEELRVLSKAFARFSPPKGKRVAIMSFSGGGAILAIDALERANLALATLSDETKAALQRFFPPWAHVANPLDIWMAVAKDLSASFPAVLEALLEDEGVDAVICIYCSYETPKYALYDCSGYISDLAATYPDTPVACWTYGLDIEGFTRRVEESGKAMVFQSLDEAAQSLSKLVEYREQKAKPREYVQPKSIGRNERMVQKKLEDASRAGRSYLFTEGLEILEAYGIRVAPWRFVSEDDRLFRDAGDLNFPLCLKAVSSDLLHKSDSGGVRLGIRNPEELSDSYAAMKRLLPTRPRNGDQIGVLIQEMVVGGREIIVGMKRDRDFGPCIVFGDGGIYAEALNDFSFRLGPINPEEARQMIEETTVAKILKGIRGHKPAFVEGIIDTLVRISWLSHNHPLIKEIDINPLFVNEKSIVAVDTRIILAS